MQRAARSFGCRSRAPVLVVVLVAGLVAALPGESSARDCTGTDARPHAHGTDDTTFAGIVAPTTCVAFAVGHYEAPDDIAIAERWNGTSWTIQELPAVEGSENELDAVAASSAKDVWAVGSRRDSSGDLGSLVEHWDGSAWTVEPTPPSAGLRGVTVLSATTAWAVGGRLVQGLLQAYVQRWDGKEWVAQPSPRIRSGALLNDVSAASSSDAWAVGFRFASATRPLALHWHGGAWHVEPVPMVGDSTDLTGVADISPSNAWAVGVMTDGPVTRGVIFHWNGTTWQERAFPHPSAGDTLDAVSATSATSMWAVGERSAKHGRVSRTFVLRWNGMAWKVKPSPSGQFSELNAVDAVTAFSAWTAGEIWHPSDSRTSPVTYHCC